MYTSDATQSSGHTRTTVAKKEDASSSLTAMHVRSSPRAGRSQRGGGSPILIAPGRLKKRSSPHSRTEKRSRSACFFSASRAHRLTAEEIASSMMMLPSGTCHCTLWAARTQTRWRRAHDHASPRRSDSATHAASGMHSASPAAVSTQALGGAQQPVEVQEPPAAEVQEPAVDDEVSGGGEGEGGDQGAW